MTSSKFPLLFFVLFVLAHSSLQGQSFLQVRGGLLLDQASFEPLITRDAGDYFGFSYLNLGIGRMKENRINGLDLDFVAFNADFTVPLQLDAFGNPLGPPDWDRKKRSADLSAYSLFKVAEASRLSIFAGPILGIGYSSEKSTPNNSLTFPVADINIRLGIGARIDAYVQLNSWLYGSIGIKGILLDVRRNEYRIENPILSINQQRTRTFEAKVLRPELYVPIGLLFLF